MLHIKKSYSPPIYVHNFHIRKLKQTLVFGQLLNASFEISLNVVFLELHLIF